MPARDRRADLGDELEQVKHQAGARRERPGERGHHRLEQQAQQHAGHRHGGNGNGGEVEQHAHRRDRPERPRGDRSGGERSAHRRAERAPADAPSERAVGPAAEARGPPERRGREPAAQIERRPRIDQEHDKTRRREQLLGPHLALAHSAAGEHQGQRRRPRGRGGPAEEPHVGGAHGGGNDQRVFPPRAEQARDQEDPGTDEPDVEAGDRQQVHQTGLGEAVLQVGVDAAAPAQHERVDQRGAGPVELAAGAGDDRPEPLRPCRRALPRPAAGDGQDASRAAGGPGARDPCALDAAGDARRARVARGPACRHRSGAAGTDRGNLESAALARHRLVQAHRQPDASRGQTSGAASGIDHPGQLAAGAAHGGCHEEQEREHATDGCRNAGRSHQDQERAHRGPETQKAGRETGPVRQHEKNRRPRRHRGRPMVRPRARRASRRSAVRAKSAGGRPSSPRRWPPDSDPSPG